MAKTRAKFAPQKHKNKALWCLIALCVLGCFPGASAYVVKPGDTLSKIAAKFIPGKVWGKNGSLGKIIVLNPHIKSIDLIFPGQNVEVSSQASVAATKNAVAALGRFPANSETKAPTISNKEFSRFTVGTKLSQSRLDATDSASGGKSVLGSAFTPQVVGRWEQHWNSGLKSYLQAQFKREDFKTSSLTQTLLNSRPMLFGFEVGARIASLGKNGALTGALALDQESFLRAKSTTQIIVDSLAVPKAKLNLNFDLLRSQTFRLVTELESAYLAPVSSASYKTKSGYGLGCSLFIRHERSPHPFFGGVHLNYSHQGTTFSKQQYINIGLMLGVDFDVSGDE